MILASIFIGPPGRGEDIELPPMVAENIDSLKRHHPNLPHKLFSGEDILAFLEAKFPREVLDAYNTLKPFAYKADLARYCILYEMGGVYADLSMYFTRPVPLDDGRPAVFRELVFSAPWDTGNALIASPPRHRAFGQAIDLVLANVRERYYGTTYLCPTGPTLFGKALAMTCRADDLITGHTVVFRRDQMRGMRPGLALPDPVRCLGIIEGKLIAVNRKELKSRGLADLGVRGSDDYAVRWTNRDVYEGG
jgi:hypothetical protein